MSPVGSPAQGRERDNVMIRISLTEFVDFVIRAGGPKLTVVRKVKCRHDEGYHPQFDFYKSLREGIAAHHRQGKPISALDSLATGLTDKKKETAYPSIIQGYKKFLGKKSTKWIEPPKKYWEHGDLIVTVNPEVGIDINGNPHLIKMYWKRPKLKKLEVASILHLLQLTLTNKKNPSTIGLLDVRRGKLITPNEFDPGMTHLLQGEAESFATIYRSI